MCKIDPRVRAIYHLMLNEKIFITDPSQNNKRFVCTNDDEVVQEIINISPKHQSALEIARMIARKLKFERGRESNEVG